MKIGNLHDLYMHTLEDVYSAETQLLEALPEMAKKTTSSKVKRAIETHLKQTEKQRERLDKIFEEMGQKPSGETCKGMQGLLMEGKELVAMVSDSATRDAAIIASANRVEHYEMAAYGTARAFAEILGMKKQAKLLQQTLDEEEGADQKLTDLAEAFVNMEATG